MMTEKLDFRQIARDLGTVMDFHKDETIFREGDPPRYVYIVLKGSVEISARQKVIEAMHESEALGILSVLDGRTITARATEPCELALLDNKKFRYMVESIPNFVWFVMRELGSRLRATNALL